MSWRLAGLLLGLWISGAAVAADVWRSGQYSQTPHGVKVWTYRHHPASPTVLFALGFSETHLKYQHTIEYLMRKGFNLTIYDHRGMGMSRRVGKHPRVAHIEYFSDYVDDLRDIVKTQIEPYAKGPTILATHSTGGLVAIHYLTRYPHPFGAVVMSAPLIEMQAGMPAWIVKAVVKTLDLAGYGEDLAPGREEYKPAEMSPEEMKTTTDAEHGRWILDLHIAHPEALVDGPSNRWVLEALNASKLAIPLAAKIKVPVTVLQASEDHYVKTEAQTVFCNAVKKCRLVEFAMTRHELFMEKPIVRHKIWNIIEETADHLPRTN